MTAYFFGCKTQTGHHHWDEHLRAVDDHASTPWGVRIDSSAFLPRTSGEQGAATLHHLDGWTALTFHDFTVDTRPGSMGAFLVDDVLDFDEAAAAFAATFPGISERVGRLTRAPNG